ncbi:hypothetical protein K2X30_01800 [bacterium]|jgi:hypothetical protein|nr:hypothetical protein [bacterium]
MDTLRCIFLFSLFAVFSRPAFSEVSIVEKDHWKVSLYGLIELDMAADSVRSFTTSLANQPVDLPGTYAGDNGRLQLSAAGSRLGLNIVPPLYKSENYWRTRANIEFDFFGALSGSQQIVYTTPLARMRLGYVVAEKEGWQILAGQHWTVFGWVPNFVQWQVSQGPNVGEACTWEPQLMVSKTFETSEKDRAQVALSFTRPPQRDAFFPGIEAGFKYSFGNMRAGFSSPAGDMGTAPLMLAVSGLLRKFVVPSSATDTKAQTSYTGTAFAVDVMIPILSTSSEKNYGNTLALSGEFATGTGAGDNFAGYSGGLTSMPTGATFPASETNLDGGYGGYDGTTGEFRLIKILSYNAQLQYHFPMSWRAFMTFGYGQISSDNVAGLTPAGDIYDKVQGYFGNLNYDFTRKLRFALEYNAYRTHFVSGSWGNATRFQFSVLFRI